ncbi:MAG: mscL [Hydrocarboniphaga sp.]|uniref:large-conductance mechanosensitive channel protein MscL n=1 Tax=Hydrocarboniphaga sp. TaxID=2033016 RepID=UPI0026324873|nr:large-conductance mechanosensitive channel protein MscL [Hydrocarboniphaga sp.]MDB5967838.1 mscL [Hydrocarboniphaga sp.]
MSVLGEFKTFAMRGNVIDLAVGVVIGAAFGKIVSSLVGDVVMPPLGLAIGGINFSDLGWIMRPAIGDKPAVVLAYGKFIQTIFDFTIIALAIFALVKGINSLTRPEPPAADAPAPPETPPDIKLLAEIRDLLKNQASAKP